MQGLIKETTEDLLVLRVDDISLLYNFIHQHNLSHLVDSQLSLHGNWTGISPGVILEIWLCYILSACDHRLSSVEDWVEENLELFQVLSGHFDLRGVNFSDDKLGDLLEMLGVDSVWDFVELGINSSLLGVYRLGIGSKIKTYRLDAAPMQGYGQVKEDGLLQYGYHKHHPNLPQFKIKLCTLDNELNNFAYPICHLTVQGNKADDDLYVNIIQKSKSVLPNDLEEEGGNLYIGDSKFGSIGNRVYVVSEGDNYLMPLSLVQLSEAARLETLQSTPDRFIEKVYKTSEQEKTLVAQGFEEEITLEQEFEGKLYKWRERRLFVRSIAYAKAQEASLDKRLIQAEIEIKKLTERKQGKVVLKTIQAYEDAVDNILKTKRVQGLLEVNIIEHEQFIKKRGYGKKPARVEVQSTFEVYSERVEDKIKEKKTLLGWQVYATNSSKELLTFQDCVWKYRYQVRIESRFDDLRNKIAPLLPVFLQKDERIRGLVNILILALKFCTAMEYKVALALKKANEELSEVYEGNPKRTTKKPSAKRILKAFKGISISLVFVNKELKITLMTKLSNNQIKILKLLGLNPKIYTDLCSKIQFLFSKQILSET